MRLKILEFPGFQLISPEYRIQKRRLWLCHILHANPIHDWFKKIRHAINLETTTSHPHIHNFFVSFSREVNNSVLEQQISVMRLNYLS